MPSPAFKKTVFKKFFVLTSILLWSLVLVACQSNEEAAVEYFEQGLTSYQAADYSTARVLFLNAMQKNPRYAPAYYYLGLLAERDNDLPLMFERLSIAISLDPANLDAKVKVARLLVLSQKFDEALSLAGEIDKLQPNHPAALLLRAAALVGKQDFATAQPLLEALAPHFQAQTEAAADAQFQSDRETWLALRVALERHRGNRAQALDLLDQLSAQASDKTPWLLMKVSLFEEMNDVAGLTQTYRQLAQENPQQPQWIVALADVYRRAQRLSEAEQVLLEHLAANTLSDSLSDSLSDKMPLVSALVEIQRADDPRRAIATLDQLIAERPGSFELRMLRAELRIAQGQVSEVEAELLAIKLDNNYNLEQKLAADALRAALLYDRNLTAEAMQLVREGLASQPRQPDLMLLRARHDLAQHSYASAATQIREVLKIEPTSEAALLLLAQVHLASGSVFLADDAFRKVLDFNPANAEALYSVANKLVQNEDLVRAENLIKNALEAQPGDKNLQRFRVQIQLLKHDLSAAEQLLATISPRDETPTALLWARLYQIQNRHDQALVELQGVLARQPDSLAALQGLVASFSALNRQAELVSWLQEHSVRHPNSLFTYAVLAQVQRASGELEASKTTLQKALQVKPDWAEGYSALAQLHQQQDNSALAIDTYQLGIRNCPEDATLPLLFAAFYEQEQNYPAAAAIYRDLLAKKPDNIIAANNYANLLLDHLPGKDNQQKALDLTRLFANETSGYYQDTVGWALVKNGLHQQAEPILRKAAQAAPGVASIHYHLGVALQGQNRIEEAKNSFKTATRYVEPGSELAGVLEKLLSE